MSDAESHSPDVTSSTPSQAEQQLALSLLRVLSSHPDLTQRQLAQVLNISLGKTNFVVRAVLARGWVKAENFRRSNHKLGYIYVLTPQGIAQRLRLTQAFVALKEQEYERLRGEIQNLRTEMLNLTSE
jgi:EPS-associated MarR family transcriptional regulator